MSVIRIVKKFRSVLSKHQKLRIFELAIMMIVGGFLEMLSVSLIMPFMTAVLEPDKIMNNDIVKWICNLFGIQISRTFLVFLAMAMALIYILKNVYLLFQMTSQNRFVYNNMFYTQRKILHSYLRRPYEFFLSLQSGEVIRVVSNDTTMAFNLLTTLLTLFSETVVSVVLVETIFYFAPGVTLGVAAIIGVMILIIQFIVRPILAKQGVKNRKSYTDMQQWLLQSVQGIKEIKIGKKEAFFEDNFAKAGNIYVKTSYKDTTLGLIPRFMIEAVSMAAFFLVVAVMLYKGAELEAIVPMLSVVAMAAIRLLPSANRISQALAQIAFREPALDKLIENLSELSGFSEEQLVGDNSEHFEKLNSGRHDNDKDFSKVIELKDITYKYPTGVKNVLEHADMVIHRGEAIGIVGVTGAGKTTVVDILLGLLRPVNGQVFIDGTDIRLDMDNWLRQVGYIPQNVFMLEGTIRQNVAFGVADDEIDDNSVILALKDAALYDFIKELPDGINTEIGERGVRLSGGQKQRIGIARALYERPEIIVFDEATSALDNETESIIMNSINSLHGKITMVIIAHRLTTIENCDVVYRVEDGKIVRE